MMQVSAPQTPYLSPTEQPADNSSRPTRAFLPDVRARPSVPISEFATFVLSYANGELVTNKYTPFNIFKAIIESSDLNPNQQLFKRPLIIHAALTCIDTQQKVNYLLEKGANPNSQHLADGTATHIFLANECHEDAANFIEQASLPERAYKLDVNSTDSRGNSLCMLAVKMRSTAAALLLINKGADCSVRDIEGRTLLHYAAISGNIELFSVLVGKHPDLLNQQDSSNRSPLDYLLLSVSDRKTVTAALLESCQINPERDEMACNNKLLDMNHALMEFEGKRISSTKNDADELLSRLRKDGPSGNNMLRHGEQSLACIAVQANSFTGKSLLDFCIGQQAKLRGTYLPQQVGEGQLSSLCSEINKRMKAVNVKFELKCKQYLPGFIDMVAALPAGKEQSTIKCIKKLLPQGLLTRHYESASLKTQFYAIEHVNLIGVQSALRLGNMPNPMTTEQARAAGYTVISAKGRPEHGTVLHMGQTHGRTDMDTPPEIHAVILRSQKALYDELLRHRPKHVFSEGVSKTRSDLRCSPNIINTFKNYRPGNPMSVEQLRVLDTYDANGLYLLLHADVTMHATSTKEFDKRNEAYVQANPRLMSIYEASELTVEDRRIMFDEREQLTMNLIKQFHQAHPGELTALIFGSQHASRDFLKHCNQSDYSPQFYFKDFSAN